MSNYFDIILFLSYGSIFMNVIVSFVIIFICNPKMGAKSQSVNACSTCILAVVPGCLLLKWLWIGQSGDVKEPGDGFVISGIQRYNFNYEARTSADVRAVKDYINISNGRPVSLIPQTKIANLLAIHQFFINDLTQEQKTRLEYNQTGKFPFPPTNPQVFKKK